MAKTRTQEEITEFYNLNKGREGQPLINLKGSVSEDTIVICASPHSFTYWAQGTVYQTDVLTREVHEVYLSRENIEMLMKGFGNGQA